MNKFRPAKKARHELRDAEISYSLSDPAQNRKRQELRERTYQFGLNIIRFLDMLKKDYVGIEIGRQLLRAGTSVGANMEEGFAAFSRKDFAHCHNIARKEARESKFWLRLLKDSGRANSEPAVRLIDESEELIKILTSIVKKLQKPLVCILASYLILHTSSLALGAKIHPAAGSTSATFLKIGVGARAVAMGGAFTAVADDPSALYWNPAGLVNNKDRSLSFSHNNYFQGLNQEFLSYILPGKQIGFLKNRAGFSGVWGVGLNYFTTPKDIERRSGLYENDPIYPISSPEGTFRAYDTAFHLGYGHPVTPSLNVGSAVKFIKQTIDNTSGSTFALDLGALYDFTLADRFFTAGLAVQNIGPGVKFISKRFALPLNFKAGISHRLTYSGALVSFDFNKPIDNYPFFILGTDYPLTGRLALRTGYRYRLYDNELGGWSGFSAGMGLLFSRFSFDYAFTPFGDLGNSHRFSVAFRFAKAESPSSKPTTAQLSSAGAVKGTLRDYDVSYVPLKISSLGVRYEVKAMSRAAAAHEIRFKTSIRGVPAVRVSVIEGDLPEPLSGTLPADLKILKAFQLHLSRVRAEGDAVFSLKIKKGVADISAEALFFLCFVNSGWHLVKMEPSEQDESYFYYKASAPLSSHCAIAIKK
ncbi:MAG: PorV/PorQ family protein [bacterium]